MPLLSILLIIFIMLGPTLNVSAHTHAKENTEKQGNIDNEKPLVSRELSNYLAFSPDKIAIKDVTLIDGTGSAAKQHQTLLIDAGRIVKVVNSQELVDLEDYRVLSLQRHTLIPGLVGTHNHMRLPQGAMLYTSPKLYLASGVTSMQTCGTGHPIEEINISRAINDYQLAGPDIVPSSPYYTGPKGRDNFIRFTDEHTIRASVKHWAEKGVKWFKVYSHTRPQDIEVIADEAHKQGAKVTGHLCASTFEQAALAGIDAIEHGFIHSYDHSHGRTPGVCSGDKDFRSEIDLAGDDVKRIQQILIDNNVAISATPSIFEAQMVSRGIADDRTQAALSPYHLQAYQQRRKRMLEKGESWYFKEDWLKRSLQYELAFFRAGGLLTAGPDPGLHNLPGYGDQRNYELFVEAGFTPEEAIQVMTRNGAKLLSLEDTGTLEAGMLANIVILDGDLTQEPSVIRQVKYVIKQGLVYNPEKLVNSVLGHVGSEYDDTLRYLGQKKPGITPEKFAPNIISSEDEHEFGSVFSQDATEFYYGVDLGGRSEIRYTALDEGVWSVPQAIISHPNYSFNDPYLSLDNQRLYYISNQPLNASGKAKDYDIWYSKRQEAGWSAPIHAGNIINSLRDEYYIATTNQGNMYFSSNAQASDKRDFNIYQSKLADGTFSKPLPLPNSVNSPYYDADVFVSPDEDYMIFSSVRRGGLGRGDLYISRKNKEGNWSPAKNMGNVLNTKGHELCPFVTRDGKYLMYTSDGDIYWVDASILNEY